MTRSSSSAGTTDGARAAREFTRELAGELTNVVASGVVVGVYLHGSAVLGDWNAPASDVDVLIVVADGVSPGDAELLAGVLTSDRACPGVGLEASVVEASAAAVPAAPWPFVVHATTAPHDRKTVWETSDGGDDDLILHYAVAREHAWVAYGPGPQSVFGPIDERTILGQLAAELRWAVEHAGVSYTVLNACRALRYRDERVMCSKTDGGNWALARDIQPALVRRALDARYAGTGHRDASGPLPDLAVEWVLGVAADLIA